LNYDQQCGSSSHLAAGSSGPGRAWTTRIPYKGGARRQRPHRASNSCSARDRGSSTCNGRLRALAVTSVRPSALAPGLPTVAEAGVPGYESAAIFGVLAPARTPPALVARLNGAIVGVLSQPETKERLFKAGSEVVASTPEAFGAAIKGEMTTLGKLIRDDTEKWARVIRAANIKVE
jgi:tripartite-type tricarboxylate transporter receptor subunit TctC